MARNFMDVVEEIKKVAPEHLAEDLEESICFWAPEALWYKLQQWVETNVEPSSKDAVAVAVYARLCDCTEEEMKARFEADGI